MKNHPLSPTSRLKRKRRTQVFWFFASLTAATMCTWIAFNLGTAWWHYMGYGVFGMLNAIIAAESLYDWRKITGLLKSPALYLVEMQHAFGRPLTDAEKKELEPKDSTLEYTPDGNGQRRDPDKHGTVQPVQEDLGVPRPA